MEFQEELKRTLDGLGLASPRYEFETTPSGKVGGFILSKSFEGKAQLERQKMIWDFLEQNLNKEQQQKIISLLTLTPDEAGLAA